MRDHTVIASPFEDVYPPVTALFGRRLAFFLEGQPPTATAQHKGERVVRGKVIHYEKEEVAAAREWISRRLDEYVPETPLAGPLCLEVFWVYRWLERHLRKNGRKKPSVEGKRLLLCPTRPDCDNLSKLFNDCLQAAGFFRDDSQIAVPHFLKAWGDDPGIAARITELKQP